MNRNHSFHPAFIFGRAVAVALLMTLPLCGHAASIDKWNLNNVIVQPPPAGGYVPETTYYSTVYTDTTLTTSHGAVIWVESDVQSPGMKVVNNDDVDGSHCIMTSGYNPVDGTVKQCTDPFQTSKRFKEAATVANSSVDLVFDVSASTDIRNYRVFHKYINAIAGTRIGAFTVQLGFGTGASFVPSTAGDGLGFATSAGVVYDPSIATSSASVEDLDLDAVFAFGLFGDADTNPNQTTDGYFDPNQRATFLLSAVEDTITSVGTPSANYYNLFNNWLAKNQVPYGYFYDEDGDPLTDATLIANWNGTAWETYTSASPQLPNTPDMAAGIPVPVAVADLAYFAAHPDTGDGTTPFYFVDFIDDLSNVNLNYHINVGATISNWPTYSTTDGTARFTLRVTNTAAADAPLPWYTTLPPELTAVDVAFSKLTVPKSVRTGTTTKITASVQNVGTANPASGVATIQGVDSAGVVVGSFTQAFTALQAGDSLKLNYTWTAPTTATTVSWTGTVTAFGDTNPGNDVLTAATIVR